MHVLFRFVDIISVIFLTQSVYYTLQGAGSKLPYHNAMSSCDYSRVSLARRKAYNVYIDVGDRSVRHVTLGKHFLWDEALFASAAIIHPCT